MTTKLSFKYLKPRHYKRIFKIPEDEIGAAFLRSDGMQRLMKIVKHIRPLKKHFAGEGERIHTAREYVPMYYKKMEDMPFGFDITKGKSLNFKTPKGKSTGFNSKWFDNLSRDEQRKEIAKVLYKDKRPILSKSRIARILGTSGSAKNTSRPNYILKEMKDTPLRVGAEIGIPTAAGIYGYKKYKEKRANVDLLSGAAGVGTGYSMGRNAAEATAHALTPYGDKTKNSQIARAAATLTTPAGAILGWALANHYKPALAKRVFNILKDRETTRFVEASLPFLSAAAGGIGAGTLTGAVSSLKRSKPQTNKKVDRSYLDNLVG